jgi:hypothetical protein
MLFPTLEGLKADTKRYELGRRMIRTLVGHVHHISHVMAVLSGKDDDRKQTWETVQSLFPGRERFWGQTKTQFLFDKQLFDEPATDVVQATDMLGVRIRSDCHKHHDMSYKVYFKSGRGKGIVRAFVCTHTTCVRSDIQPKVVINLKDAWKPAMTKWYKADMETNGNGRRVGASSRLDALLSALDMQASLKS